MHLHNHTTGFSLKEGKLIGFNLGANPENNKNEAPGELIKKPEAVDTSRAVEKGKVERADIAGKNLEGAKGRLPNQNLTSPTAEKLNAMLTGAKKMGQEYVTDKLNTIDASARSVGNAVPSLRGVTDAVNQGARAGIDMVNGKNPFDKKAQKVAEKAPPKGDTTTREKGPVVKPVSKVVEKPATKTEAAPVKPKAAPVTKPTAKPDVKPESEMLKAAKATMKGAGDKPAFSMKDAGAAVAEGSAVKGKTSGSETPDAAGSQKGPEAGKSTPEKGEKWTEQDEQELNKITGKINATFTQLNSETVNGNSAPIIKPGTKFEWKVDKEGNMEAMNTSDPKIIKLVKDVSNTLLPNEKALLAKATRVDTRLGKMSFETDKDAPKTLGEKLERDLDKHMQELKNAENGTDKFKAMLKLLGTLMEYAKNLRNLDQPLANPNDKNNAPAQGPANKPGEVNNNAPENKDARARVDVKLNKDDKGGDSEKLSPANTAKRIEREKTKNSKETEANTKEITNLKELNKDLETTNKSATKNVETLTKQRTEKQDQLKQLENSQKPEDAQKKLELQNDIKLNTEAIDKANESIAANKKLIENNNKKITDLEKKQTELKDEKKVLEGMDKESDGFKKIADILKQVGDLMGMDISMEKDGDGFKIVIRKAPDEIRKALKPDAKKDAPLEIKEKDMNKVPDQKPTKSAETKKPSANEIQNGRLNVVAGHINSLGAEFGQKLEGSQFTGAKVSINGVDVRYDQSAHTWQVKQPKETTWKDPANEDLGKGNEDLSQRLKIFNKELTNWNEDEKEALKREQTA